MNNLFPLELSFSFLCVPIVFSSAVSHIWTILCCPGQLLRLGVNMKNFPTSTVAAIYAILFQLGIAAVLLLYVLFWLKVSFYFYFYFCLCLYFVYIGWLAFLWMVVPWFEIDNFNYICLTTDENYVKVLHFWFFFTLLCAGVTICLFSFCSWIFLQHWRHLVSWGFSWCSLVTGSFHTWLWLQPKSNLLERKKMSKIPFQ